MLQGPCLALADVHEKKYSDARVPRDGLSSAKGMAGIQTKLKEGGDKL